MTTFDEAVRAWREASFPRGTVDDDLDDAHSDLALYDSWVAESVLPYADGGEWTPAVPDVLGELDRFTKRVEELRAAGTDDPEAAASYLAYAALLRDAYEAFLRDGGGEPGGD
ncbi:hypothetical protein [Nocardioides sp. TF02-7]|uniref:hypothetical protein n=1 Tax=Nocardioides sp. TF02-7 TaxID=2917724 RepID=UPI001F05BDCB|nr:hypothetical protein [Nocardioides sp. TF02-7]UMG91013.1 hypothetical protein MF408_12310 [Nocardioides sp. TF02-7]